MTPGKRFALGAAAIVLIVTLMIAQGVSQTSQYFFTPAELIQKVQANPEVRDLPIKVSAKVVKGSIRRDNANRRVDFQITDGKESFPVTYTGLVPDTFTDANDIDVVVEGKLGYEGVFVATDVIAKCGSRYEAVWDSTGTIGT